MKAYRYSPHSQSFYTFNEDGVTLGLGVGKIAENLGLWNLAWLASDYHETYAKSGTPLLWSQEFEQAIIFTGNIFVGTQPLREHAAEMSAMGLVKSIYSHPDFADALPIAKLLGSYTREMFYKRAASSSDLLLSPEVRRVEQVSRGAPPIVSMPELQRLCGTVISMEDWFSSLQKFHT